MKSLNKLLALILCLAVLLNLAPAVYGSGMTDIAGELKTYTVQVTSNEYKNEYVTFYQYAGKFYLDLKDIKDFTRCTLTENEETLTLTHGIREIVFTKSTGNMVDSGLVDQGRIPMLSYRGMFLCEGIPMLRYLGASCSIRNEGIEVLMPEYTIWESIMPDYLDYFVNINEWYGGEGNVKIALVCDIIADIFDGVSGRGMFANADMHLEDALYEILNVDLMKYSSAQQAVITKNQKNNDFLSSAVFKTILDTADNTYEAVYEGLEYYCKFYTAGKNDILLDAMSQTDDLNYASELAAQIQKQVYSQSAAKVNLKDAKNAQSFMDIGMLAFDTAATSISLMRYDDDTRKLFARTINQEMFECADYYDVGWKNVSDKISDTLKSKQSIVANTAVDKVTQFAVEKVTEEGAKTALSAFTSKANLYHSAAQIGSFVASLINYDSNQAFSADMNAIWLSAVQYDIAMIASSLLAKERDGFHFSDVESLERLKNIFTLYYRTTIAVSENMAHSIEEFGKKKDQKWVDWFAATEGNSVSNNVAAYLYSITNCTIVPIVDYQSCKDDVITDDWIAMSTNGGIGNDADLVSSAYIYGFRDYRGEYCYHIPHINLQGNRAGAFNKKIYDELYDCISKDVRVAVEKGDYPYPSEIIYTWGRKDNLVSIVIKTKDEVFTSWTEYDVYTVSLVTGKEVSYSDLVTEYDLTTGMFYEKVKTVLKQYWEDNADNVIGFVGKDVYDDLVSQTLQEANVRAAIPYINSKGELCFIAEVYWFAGSETYTCLFNTVSMEEEPAIECTENHFDD